MAIGSTQKNSRVVNIDIPTSDMSEDQLTPMMQQFMPLPADAARVQGQNFSTPYSAAPAPAPAPVQNQQPVGPLPQRKPPDPTAQPAYGGYASGGPTYGLSSVPQVSAPPIAASSNGPASPYVSSANGMNSPYVAPANGMNSPYVAQIGSNGMPNPYYTGSQMAKGGRAKLADGGIPSAAEMDPWYARAEARGELQPEGLVHGLAGGRTDVHNISVPSGSYVLPADVVSGLAEGNTMSGASVMDRMMHSNPYGIAGGGKGGRGMGIPRPPSPYKPPGEFKKGGPAHHSSKVDIVVAGGESIYYPETIIKKFGSLKQGHAALDAFVKKVRAENLKNISKLPGPKK